MITISLQVPQSLEQFAQVSNRLQILLPQGSAYTHVPQSPAHVEHDSVPVQRESPHTSPPQVPQSAGQEVHVSLVGAHSPLPHRSAELHSPQSYTHVEQDS